MLRLEKVNGKNVWELLKLKVAEYQEDFVAPNDVSVIEAYTAVTGNGQAFPFGIYDDDIPVGFLMIGYDVDDDWDDAPQIARGNYNLWRLMIDERFQGKGYGREAVRLALDFIKTFPCGCAAYCWLSYEPENDVARKLYHSFGFRETGEYDGEEVIAVLSLTEEDGAPAEDTYGDITIKPYTAKEIPDILSFEAMLREEEDFWGWEIDEAYLRSVEASFRDRKFQSALSFIAYVEGQAVGRIDAVLIPSHFDGSVKAYLDWICVVKHCRHRGVAQALLAALKKRLKAQGVDTLIALTASNDEAQRFYQSIPDSEMHDIGIWINI
ncbi:MAG: GNAT family N-acetyltransferase [Lachnospiraceae bacterium]|nr:GNAT family N-acetyltransferase [Lachnospiraceae bacterium]